MRGLGTVVVMLLISCASASGTLYNTLGPVTDGVTAGGMCDTGFKDQEDTSAEREMATSTPDDTMVPLIGTPSDIKKLVNLVAEFREVRRGLELAAGPSPAGTSFASIVDRFSLECENMGIIGPSEHGDMFRMKLRQFETRCRNIRNELSSDMQKAISSVKAREYGYKTAFVRFQKSLNKEQPHEEQPHEKQPHEKQPHEMCSTFDAYDRVIAAIEEEITSIRRKIRIIDGLYIRFRFFVECEKIREWVRSYNAVRYELMCISPRFEATGLIPSDSEISRYCRSSK